MRILFDATVLKFGLYHNSCRSGIFMVAREFLYELTLRKGLEIDLYAPPDAEDEVRSFLLLNPEFSHLEVNPVDYFGHLGLFAAQTGKYSLPRQETALLRFLGSWYSSLVSFLQWWANAGVRFNSARTSALLRQRYQAYFSPMHASPTFVIKSGIPRYTVLYDTIPFLFPEYCPRPKGGELWQDVLMRTLRSDDHGFAISNCTKIDFLKTLPRLKDEHIKVIPLGASYRFVRCSDQAKIADTLKKYKVPTDRPYFLSLCTIEPRKNLPLALRAFSEFAKTNEDAIFVLAGGGWDSFESFWQDSLSGVDKVRDRIFLTGYVADEDLAALYSAALAFVFLSQYEGFGLPPLEAMQCGTPVICSTTSSLPEVVGDAGFLVGINDTSDVVIAMHKLYEDRFIRDDLSKKGIERAKLFSWGNAVDLITNEMFGGSMLVRQFCYKDVNCDDNRVFRNGFSPSEGDHRWSCENRVTFRFSSPAISDKTMAEFRIRAVPFLAGGVCVQHAHVYANGLKIAEWILEKSEVSELAASFRYSVGNLRDLIIEIVFPDAISPKDLGLSPDTRRLALSFMSVSLVAREDVSRVSGNGLELKEYRFSNSYDTDYVLYNGFGPREPWGVWCVGKRSEMTIKLPETKGDLSLVVTAQCFGDKCKKVQVLADDTELAVWNVASSAPSDYVLDCKSLPRGKEVDLVFVPSATCRPCDVIDGNADARELSLGLIAMKLN